MTANRTEANRKRFNKLVASQYDLSVVRDCAEMLLKEALHRTGLETVRRPAAMRKQTIYMTALVISYGRVFTGSKGWVGFPGRLLKIFNTDEKGSHDELLVWRDKLFAHSDGTLQKIVTLGHVPRPDGRSVRLDMISGNHRYLTAEQTQRVIDMVNKLDDAIEIETARIYPGIADAAREQGAR